MDITTGEFGRFWNRNITSTVLSNKNGMEVEVLNYGCIIRRIVVPGKDGKADVVLGFDTLADYLYGHPFFGAIAGRVANRIHNGRFTLNGKNYALATNEAPTGQHLHGGIRGFDKYVWDTEEENTTGEARLILRRTSPDGEEGYPGALDVEHSITLDEDNGITLTFKATARNQDTIVNLVNHGYYNLGGHQSLDVTPHTLHIHGSAITPVDEHMIPTGELMPVTGTPYDFTKPVSLAKQMQAQPNAFFDINYVLDQATPAENGLFKAVDLLHPASGRRMQVSTDQPGIQFYNAAKLNNRPWIGKGGARYSAFSGMCFEAQAFPDAPNHANFPSIVVRKGETRVSRTVHRFSW